MSRKTTLDRSQAHGIVTDLGERAKLEARNALRQFDEAMSLVEKAIAAGNFKLRPSTICDLNRVATEGLNATAGLPRQIPVKIEGSGHKPPPWQEVTRLLEEICDYVNDHWSSTPIHLAAYLMWRVNWVHPFEDGNGRTSRMIAYVVLCIRLGFKLPGTQTIPEQISKDKEPYYLALEQADAAFKNGDIKVPAMEELLKSLLATQLLAVHNQAGGAS